MMRPLKQLTADHRYLLDLAARHGGFTAPIAVRLDEFETPLLKKARRGAIVPIDGVLVRDWDAENRRQQPGIQMGIRIYEIDGVRLVRVRFDPPEWWGNHDFFVVDRKDYRRLFRIALRCRREMAPPTRPPVLPAETAAVLWQNTIGYLEPANLRRIRRYGGRAKRGVLLMGPPGNGKTMACRWIWEECRQRGWDWRLVTPDSYRNARSNDSVHELFSVSRRGIIFFDDMDLALRDRESVHETEDQAVFLSALDGITVTEGVVFVFTSNCAPELIDRAFKRPGRLDLVLPFPPPDAALRRQLIEGWHADIRAHVDMDAAVASTDGSSFAEIEELKNLLILHYTDSGAWNWSWAREQFDLNRRDLTARRQRRLGFDVRGAVLDGCANGD